MIKQNHREDSPMAKDVPMMSPTTKRRSEFIFSRARSTLSSLGDVWRPKTNTTPPRSPKSQSTNKSTLDFFLWPRHKKTTNSDDLASFNPGNRKIDEKKYATLPSPKSRILVDNSNKNKSTLVRSDKEKSILVTNEIRTQKKLSRNKSLDIEAILGDVSHRVEELSRSFEEKINLLDNEDRYNGYYDYSQRPRSYCVEEKRYNLAMPPLGKNHQKGNKHILFNDENNSAYSSKKQTQQQQLQPLSKNFDERVIKAKLKLQKFVQNDDLAKSRTHRHSSVEPKSSNSFPDRSISPTIFEVNTSDEETEIFYRDDTDYGKTNKITKKLSFREPEVETKKYDTFPRRYEHKNNENINLEVNIFHFLFFF